MMNALDVRRLQERKDELWTFMWDVKRLIKVLPRMQISGTREQFVKYNDLIKLIEEMD